MHKKVAYLMHVDWNWIKQRPHFLAEKLSNYYDLDLYFVRNYSTLNKNVNELISDKISSTNIICKVPLSSRYKSLQYIEKKINKYKFDKISNKKYDFLYITSPILLQFFDLDQLSYNYLIYDCMDDHLAFSSNEFTNNRLLKYENTLLAKADLILASSNYLRGKLIKRGLNNNITLLNNAIEKEQFTQSISLKEEKVKSTKNINIIYFGTISHWFDFNTLLSILDDHKDLVFTLIGPKEVKIPNHSRLIYKKAIKHIELKDTVSKADAFIMPFILEELVLSVDPVKIYEYIALGKPTFAIQYSETLKFNDFIYLYKDKEELSCLIHSLKEQNDFVLSKGKIQEFINVNNWNERAKQLNELMERLN